MSLTPETMVWVSTARAGISYHVIADRKTVCGRFMGNNGHVLPLADAVMRFDSEACKRCTGTADVVAPRCAPSRDRK